MVWAGAVAVMFFIGPTLILIVRETAEITCNAKWPRWSESREMGLDATISRFVWRTPVLVIQAFVVPGSRIGTRGGRPLGRPVDGCFRL